MVDMESYGEGAEDLFMSGVKGQADDPECPCLSHIAAEFQAISSPQQLNADDGRSSAICVSCWHHNGCRHIFLKPSFVARDTHGGKKTNQPERNVLNVFIFNRSICME